MVSFQHWGMALPLLGGLVLQGAGPGTGVGIGQEAGEEEWLAYAQAQVRRIKTHNKVLPQGGQAWFEVVEGSARVLISAPHATSHMREGRLKPSDAGTGGLAILLNKVASTPVLLTTWAAPSDPNFYEGNAYKDELALQVRKRKPLLVLDLHASSEGRPFDVDFGTMHGASLLGKVDLLDKLKACLREAGITRLSDNHFPAASQATVTRFLAGHKVACIQLEINRAFLHPDQGAEDAKRYLQLARALRAFISQVEGEL